MVAIGLSGIGRTRLEIDRDQREQQREKVRKIMPSLGKQSQRVCSDAGNDEQHNVGQGHSERYLQNSRRTAGTMNVHVHASSVKACATGFKRINASGSRDENTNET